jgi:hypothetical protein
VTNSIAWASNAGTQYVTVIAHCPAGRYAVSGEGWPVYSGAGPVTGFQAEITVAPTGSFGVGTSGTLNSYAVCSS